MSKQLNIHLFNCDRTYKLDVVEKWLNAARVKSKLGIDFEVKQHIFPLSKMTELCSETIPSLQMDVAVFVVHAHESQLSINEENAGIGYAKLYRALLAGTGNKVLIVIGGDDSYKDKNEEDTVFISRWAKRKISSQFSEELIDGRKSFIFSWNQEHRAIHEEALVHFLDERERGEKFEYQPKGKSSQVSETAMSPTANKSTWGKDPRERKSTQKGNGSDTTRLDTLFAFRDKPIGMNTYPGASRGKGMTEKKNEGCFRMDGGDPLQSDTFWKASWSSGNTTLDSGKEGSYRHMGDNDHSVGSDPRQSGTFPTLLQSGALGNSSSGGYPSLNSDKPGAFQGLAPAESKDTLQKDLSILGWDASPEAMSAVVNMITRHRDALSLSTDIDCLNGSGVNDLISYFEHNPLKYCVLVVDANKIKKGVNLRLLQIADKTVEKGIMITVCCPWFQSEQDKSLCGSAIENAFLDSRKVFITWFENGNGVVSPDGLINFLTSYPFPQQPSAATNCPPRGVTGKQRLPYPWDYKIHLLSGKTVLVLTRICNGIISDQINQPEDVQYWKPGFVVPPEIKASLKKNAKTSNGELFILMTKDGTLACQVNKKDEKDWQNLILLGLDETIVLQTQLRHGQISFEDKHVVNKKENLRVSQDQITKLHQDYKETPSAHLFIASDSKGNLRYIVKVEDDPGKKRQVSNPTTTTAAESTNPRTSEPHTSLPKLPGKKKSDERPSKEVPEERTAAQIRPTSQGARSKQRNSIATESAHESTVSPGDKVLIDKRGGFQGNTSRKASSSSGHTSLYSDKPGGFEDLAAAESKKTPQKENMEDLRGASVQTPALGGVFPGPSRDIRQHEANLERQLREMRERERNLQSQLSEMRQREENLEKQLRETQQRQETCDWVISRGEIQMTNKCLGRGGWGSVYEGVYCGCTVAVKQIHDLILSPHNILLFEREMNIASMCRHPHLLQFIGATNDEGSPLFVTELMEKSLRALLGQQQLAETEIRVISLDVARAINYLHQKKPKPIIHRDVSSANVLLWQKGDQWRGKVSDYGTANFMQQIMTVAPGAMIYSAPEALTSNQTVKVDVYSFGVLLCEMCIRQLPDPTRREQQVLLMTNRALRDLVRRCLQTDPEARPTMQEIIDELFRAV